MLAEIIHKIAGFEKEEWAYKPRPSNAGPERCIRQLVYNASKTPQDRKIGDRFVHILNDGIWHEELTNNWIRKSVLKLHSEQMAIDLPGLFPWMPEGTYRCNICDKDIPHKNCHGHIDGIVTDMLEQDYHYEHKGMNHFTFQRYVKETYPLDYFTQDAFYLRGIRRDNPDIDKSILLIKNKNTSAFMEFLLQYNHEVDSLFLLSMSFSETGETKRFEEPPEFPLITQTAIDRFKQVDKHVKAKTLPDRPHELNTTFPCGYCSWEKTCWSTYADEVDAITENEADLTEIADTARFYNELGAQMGDMKKQRDEVKAVLRKKLVEKNVRGGIAGEYEVKLSLTEKKEYTVKAKMSETLRVNKLKQKEA